MRNVFAGLICVLALNSVSAVHADEITLTDGSILQGTVKGSSLVLTTQQGRIEAPLASVEILKTLGGGNVEIRLQDGAAVAGTLDPGQLSLSQGLIDRLLPISSIRTVRFTPPPLVLPEGTSVSLMLAKSLSSASARLGDPVTYCVSEAVKVGDREVIALHAPAKGSVLGSGGGMNVEGGQKLGVSAEKVLAADGTWVPVQGRLEVESGFDPGRGLLVAGGLAVATAGAPVRASTRQATTIQMTGGGPTTNPEDDGLAEVCQEYFKFQGEELIDIAETAPNQDYAPVAQPMRLSIPLSNLFLGLTPTQSRGHNFPQVRHFESDGVSLAQLVVSLALKRKGSALMTIEPLVAVRPSHDRWVAFKYDLVADGRTVKSLVVNRIDAEERKTTTSKASVLLLPSELESLRTATSARLVVAMTSIYN